MNWQARFGRADFSKGQAVTLNGAPLPLPVTADFANGAEVAQRDTPSGVYQAKQQLDPIDARIAITRSDGWNPDKDLFTTEMDEGAAFARGRSAQDVEAMLNQGKDVADRTQVKRVIVLGNGKVNIIHSETPNEAARRWQRTDEPLSFHSAIPANPMHSQYVMAYDLAIGPTRSVMEEGFYAYLCRVADWRLDWKKKDENWDDSGGNSVANVLEDLPAADVLAFYNDEQLTSHGFKELIDDTVNYRQTGQQPVQMSIDMPELVASQTIGGRLLGRPLQNGGTPPEGSKS